MVRIIRMRCAAFISTASFWTNTRIWTRACGPRSSAPALADRKGWAVFIGTPKGRNALFDTWTRASADPQNWYALMLKASETGLIAQDELDLARRELSDDAVRAGIRVLVRCRDHRRLLREADGRCRAREAHHCRTLRSVGFGLDLSASEMPPRSGLRRQSDAKSPDRLSQTLLNDINGLAAPEIENTTATSIAYGLIDLD